MALTNYQVVIADDDEDDRFIIGDLFRQHCPDCVFRFAENGQKLIDLVEASDGPPTALILLDLNMPVLNGFDTLRYLKGAAHLRHIPVVVLTTSGEPSDVDQSYALGANAFMTKPGDHDDLALMVKRLYEFWLRMARLPGVSAPVRAERSVHTCPA